ncbi:MAG: hypothetical protein ACK5MZ_01355 [Aestuariibaculum sp.]
MKEKINWVIFSFLSLLMFQSCFQKWSESELKEFEINCSKTDTVDGISISFTGFDYSEIAACEILRIHNGNVVDTLFAEIYIRSYDSIRNRYHASINKTLFIKDSYRVELPSHKFVLSDMKMVMWPQFTMFSEGYGCEMGDYKIDGKRFEHSANPDFIKKDYEFNF